MQLLAFILVSSVFIRIKIIIFYFIIMPQYEHTITRTYNNICGKIVFLLFLSAFFLFWITKSRKWLFAARFLPDLPSFSLFIGLQIKNIHKMSVKYIREIKREFIKSELAFISNCAYLLVQHLKASVCINQFFFFEKILFVWSKLWVVALFEFLINILFSALNIAKLSQHKYDTLSFKPRRNYFRKQHARQFN
jgi:hypothetical protein